MKHRLIQFTPFYRLALIFGCLAFGVALAAFAYTGTFTRYWADDYCYNAALESDGFWKAQWRFYQHTSDRYSVIPLVGLSEIFGPSAIRFWPVTAVILLVSSLTWAFYQAGKALNGRFSWLECLLLAEIAAFFTLWQAPNLFQILYWRTGMLTYLMPLIFLAFLAGWLMREARRERAPMWKLFLVGLLAFFAGGFSETNAALQAGFLGLVAVGVWVGRRAGTARLLVAAALAGTLLAMVTLFLSPSNALRMVHMPESASLPVLVTQSFRFGVDFIRDTFVTQPLPTLVSLLAPLAFGAAYQHLRPLQLPAWRFWLAAALILLVTYLLVVCCMAPSVYVEVAYPEPRALIAARFALTLGLALVGWLVGASAVRIAADLPAWNPGLASAAGLLAVILLAATSLYPLRATRAILAEVPAYQERAQAWDLRDQEIRRQIAAGELDVTVNALDSIAGLMEFRAEPDGFPNNCAAGAYQIRSITGINP